MSVYNSTLCITLPVDKMWITSCFKVFYVYTQLVRLNISLYPQVTAYIYRINSTTRFNIFKLYIYY